MSDAQPTTSAPKLIRRPTFVSAIVAGVAFVGFVPCFVHAEFGSPWTEDEFRLAREVYTGSSADPAQYDVKQLAGQLNQIQIDYQLRLPASYKAVNLLSDLLGSVVALTCLSSLVLLVLLRRREYELAMAWLAVMAGGALVNEVAKRIVARERPPFVVNFVVAEQQFEPRSFPSGHAMGSTDAYLFLAYLLGRFRSRRVAWELLAVGVGLALLTCATRVYLGKHFVSDVVGGMLLGVFWVSLWVALLEWRREQTAGPVQGSA